MAILGPFLDQNRVNLGDFGPLLGRSGVTLRSLRDHYGIVLASFWGRFGVVFDPFGWFLGLFRPKPVIVLGVKNVLKPL